MKDVTKHDKEKHLHPTKTKSPAWYKFWGNKCPVCEAPAEFAE